MKPELYLVWSTNNVHQSFPVCNTSILQAGKTKLGLSCSVYGILTRAFKSFCHFYHCTTMPIITFTVCVWSFMSLLDTNPQKLTFADCIMTNFVVIQSIWTQSFKKAPAPSFQCGCVFKGLQVWSCLLILRSFINVLLAKETLKPNCLESNFQSLF